jgi:RHS repeat-associated protein
LTPQTDGRYRYAIRPCTTSCLPRHWQDNWYQYPVIDLNEQVPRGNVYSFTAGDNVLKGWANDSESSTTSVKLYIDDTALNSSETTANLTLSNPPSAFAGQEFNYPNLQAILEANEVNLYLPFTLDIRVLDGSASNYNTSIGKVFIPKFFNSAPVAVSDAIKGELGNSVMINILYNDPDAEGHSLTPIEISQPEHGSVSVMDDNRTIFYSNYGTSTSGTDKFSYQIRDEKGDTSQNVATVTVYFSDLRASDDTVYVDWDTTSTGARSSNISKRIGKASDALVAVASSANDVVLDVLGNDENASYGNIDIALGNVVPTNGSLIFHDDNTITYTRIDASITTDCFNYYFTKDGVPSNKADVCLFARARPIDDNVGVATNTTTEIYVLSNDKWLSSEYSFLPVIGERPEHGTAIEFGDNSESTPPSYKDTPNNVTTLDISADSDSRALGGMRGFVQYTPNDGHTGLDSFTYSIRMLRGSSAQQPDGKPPLPLPPTATAKVSITVGDLLAKPVNTTLTKLSAHSLAFGWDAITWTGNHVTTYELMQAAFKEPVVVHKIQPSDWKDAGTVDSTNTSFIFDHLTNNTYYYKVRSCKDGVLCSGWSDIVSKTLGPVISTTFVMTDILGSPVAEFDYSGTVTSRRHYQPFGKSLEAPKEGIGYAGHEYDEFTSLNYMQARYYDSEIGRFMSPDPVGFTEKNLMSFNRYLYVNNNPYKYVDPDGNFIFTAIAIISAGITVYDTYQTYQTYQTYKNEGAAAAVKGLAVDTALNMAGGGVLKVSGKVFSSIKKALKRSCCFVAGTQVLTENGYKAIEDVKMGERLWSKNTDTGAQDFKPVTKIFVEPGRDIFEIKLVGNDGFEQNIEATDDHPFYVVDQGWKTTLQLQSGDQIETDDDAPMRVVSVTDENRQDVTYNFTVADFHTYYVSKRNVLVHNCAMPVRVNVIDPAADALAERLGGVSSVRFPGRFKDREFDILSDRYIGQTKPANFNIGSAFRKQAKASVALSCHGGF